MPAYTVLSDAEVQDQDAAKAKRESLGFSGAVVMRVAGRETQYAYEPGPARTTPVKFETLVYSFEQDELVWAGVSRTVDPTKIEDFISELANAVTKQMAKDERFVAG